MRKSGCMKKGLCLAALVGAVALGSAGVVGSGVLASAESAPQIQLSGKVMSTYNPGDKFVMPQGTVTVNGQQYEADSILYCPDGTATDREEITLTTSGEYVLEYVASVGGKYYTEKKIFTVTNETLAVDGQGYISYESYKGRQGAMVHMQEGDRLVCNQVINLSHFEGTDELFRMFAIPQAIGQEDFSRFEVEIQDIYDADKKVTIEAKQYLSMGNHRNLYSYCNVKVGDGIFIGMEEYKGGTIEFEGKKYHLHRGDQYGSPIRYSFTAKQAGIELGDEWIGICYDYESNVVRSKNQTSIHPIADLDSSVFLTDIFTGFTTGEVRISIKPTNYVRSSCTLFVSHFAGESLTEGSFFIDSEKPDLKVDFNGYEEANLPVAAVGVPYRIFDSSAFDIIDGVVDTSYRVYYGYNTENPFSIDVVDGVFTPEHAGLYTIQYIAKDRSGNAAVKNVQIRAYAGLAGLALNVTPAQTLVVGEKQKVAEACTISGAVGRTSVSAVATLRSNPNVQYAMDDSLCFTPLYSGEYDVTFSCSDYYQTVSVAKTVNVQAADKVLYEVNGVFPDYLLKKGVYEFPTVTAIDLSSGKPVSSQAKLYLIEDAGDEIEYVAGASVGASDNVVLRYRYSADEYHDVFIPVVNAGLNTSRIYMKEYFVPSAGAFDVNATADGVSFTITNADDGAALNFINALNTSKFSFSIKPIEGKGWKENMVFSVYLRDSVDENDVLKFTYLVKEDGIYVSANNGKEYYVCASFANEDDGLELVYSAEKGSVVINEKLTVLTPTDLNGKPFNGFVNPAQLTVCFEEGFAVGSGVTVCELNGQKISNSRYDQSAPSLVHGNVYYGEKRLNDVVTVLPCYAYDVLTPDVKAYLVVTGPDGNPVRDVNGVLLDGTARADVERRVRFERYGQYDFVLQAYDALENEVVYSFTAYVINMEQPTVTVNTSYIRGKVGESVALAGYTVGGVEDLSKCTVFITVKNPNNCMEYLGAATHYTPTMRGEYVVHISVLDEYQNLGEATYTLIVG